MPARHHVDLAAAPRSGLVPGRDGALRLAPRAPGGGPPPPPEALAGPAGVAVDPEGAAILADPATGRPARMACDGVLRPLGCLAVTAGGMAMGPRGALYVAEPSAGRVLLLDPSTGGERGRWEGAPLVAPADVAAGADGVVYVADPGAGRLHRLDADGRALPGEWPAAGSAPERPVAAWVAPDGGGEAIVALDRPGARAAAVRSWSPEGAPRPEVAAGFAAALGPGPDLGVRVGPCGALGLRFGPDGRLAGTGAEAPALALDAAGRLAPSAPAAADDEDAPGRATAGAVTGGPVVAPPDGGEVRVRARADGRGPGARVRLGWLATAAGDPAPQAPGADPRWTLGPAGALDLPVRLGSGEWLWVAALLEGDGRASPVLRGLAVETDPFPLADHLPPAYRGDAPGLVDGLAGLVESIVADAAELTSDMPRLARPAAAPEPDWLGWLAGWVATELGEGWPAGRRRDLVARAFELHGRRGTAAGLADLVRARTGVDVAVDEPPAAAWVLGAPGSSLGLTTGLAPAEPAGAILAATAVLDASHLIDEEDAGAPLGHGIAHRARVSVDAAAVRAPAVRRELERIVEAERPAHVEVHLCVRDARFRVGAQARVGVDSIVAATPGARPAAGGPRIGRARAAITTRLT